MIVKDATVSLASERQFSAVTSRRESLRAWVGSQGPNSAGQSNVGGRLGTDVQDEASIDGLASATATALESRAAALRTSLTKKPAVPWRVPHQSAVSYPKSAATEDCEDEDAGLDVKTRIAKWVAEQMLGVKIHIRRLGAASAPSAAQEAVAQAAQQTVAWGVDYQRTDSYTESETTAFQADGLVETASGEQISFSVSLEMSRQFSATTQVSLQAGAAAVDPLVINLEGGAGQLTDTRFDFDLDADGDTESVPFVTQGSGVLVFDRNGDNVANDGSELFGPTTGDGFAELAALDGDGNGWIDDADAAMVQLRLWTKDAQGIDSMQTLAQAGVGAIYLGHADTQFSVRDQANGELGEVVSTGVYLKEDGGAGTVQQVNLTAAEAVDVSA